MPRHSLCGKKIKLSCTLQNKQGETLGEYGSVLVVGRDLSVKLAEQLLGGQSATLVTDRPLKSAPDVRSWPAPVTWGPLEAKGMANAKTVSVHAPIYFDGAGCGPSWLKLRAAPATFSILFNHSDQTISTRALGQFMIKAILAGSGNRSAFRKYPFPPGVPVAKVIPGKVQRERAVSITININHDGEEHAITFLAERDVFQKLASLHNGETASDVRFGHILRDAFWEVHRHLVRTQPINGKKRGKSPQRVAWKTAAWLGPALLTQLRLGCRSRSKVIETIRTRMTQEKVVVKQTVRNMAAFLVNKNWMNYIESLLRLAEDKKERQKIETWRTAFTPLRMTDGHDGTVRSVEFWDEIYNQQCHMKRFPWGRLRNTNKSRYKELMEQPCRDRYLKENPGCDWEKLKNEHRAQFNRLINEFINNKDFVDRHVNYYQFSYDMVYPKHLAQRMKWTRAQRRELRKDTHTGNMLLANPTPGPTFILPKSLEETVNDILSDRTVFILNP